MDLAMGQHCPKWSKQSTMIQYSLKGSNMVPECPKMVLKGQKLSINLQISVKFSYDVQYGHKPNMVPNGPKWSKQYDH